MDKGYSIPYGAPIYGKPPYYMTDARMVRVSYEIDPAAAQAALPPELELVGNTAMAFVGEMTQLPYIGKFHEGGITLRVRHGETEGLIAVSLFTSTDASLLVGREVYGMTKLLCDDTPLYWAGNEICGNLQRMGEQLFSIKLNVESVTPPAELVGSPTVKFMSTPRLGVRILPDPSLETTAVHEVVRAELYDTVLSEMYEGTASIRFGAPAFSNIASLAPINDKPLRGAYVRGTWALGKGEILGRFVHP
ncbi:acetoacetate decarboxylase family protein [Mesorhizobium sp. CAU 1741]|uniref:acetoacetate decarboxylase family protein n=1 Tax=Mesorhizobium sp. CAU 1741 TaxID=3140366 RepID=UPI00325B6728